MHGLDLAMLSLDNGAVELAIVGAVEVKSDYHSRIDVASREVAISCLLAPTIRNQVTICVMKTIYLYHYLIFSNLIL
jgi:hypothetical protein